MPWTLTDVLMERRKFVTAALRGGETMVDLCRRFGISRKTGYKILARHEECGMVGLAAEPQGK
ncbi:MAG: helix-turn-helix domain-containing protein [Planctomycetes bacterium]|nr:helix-turn-helix domain-containing protein [Planctomycetota bacterium]